MNIIKPSKAFTTISSSHYKQEKKYDYDKRSQNFLF